MVTEGSVIAVAGTRRLLLYIAGAFWLVVGALSPVTMAYFVFDIFLTSTGMTLGPFEPADPSANFFAIATVITIVSLCATVVSWRKFAAINSALAITLDQEMRKAAGVILKVRTSSEDLMASARSAIEKQNTPRDDNH